MAENKTTQKTTGQQNTKNIEDYTIAEQIEMLENEKRNLENRAIYMQGMIDQLKKQQNK